MEWLQDNIWTLISTVLGGGGLLGWLTERNKRKIEEKQASAEALDTMQKAYDRFTEHHLNRYESVMKDLDKLNTKVFDLESELLKEKGKLTLLKEENESLRRDNATLKADYDILKGELDTLKSKQKTR